MIGQRIVESPFDSKRYALLAQGKRRVESPVLHFEFRNSDFENGERVESAELRVYSRALRVEISVSSRERV